VGVGPEEYRRALRRFATGVTIVTVHTDDGPHGMTASSFAAVSLEPPLILVSLEKSSRTRTLILESGTFAVNILSVGQESISREFATRGDKSFADLPHKLGVTRAPILDGSLAWIECTTKEWIDAGDHDVVIAEVIACDVADGESLVYYDRDYRTIKDL
jgi:3-hydroxy-9,10-secoandrosta-1,3,5(10)-triene-9,17-dione monooxygenase reductase component